MSGKTFLYYGTMNSGKSASLLMNVYNLREKGYPTLILKPKTDTRDGNLVKSRALGTSYEAMLIDEDDASINHVSSVIEKDRIRFLFIDEAQFIAPEAIEHLSMITYKYGLRTFFYGLKNSFNNELFEGSKKLIEVADSIREMKSTCDHCGAKATTHLRKIDGEYVFDGDQVLVGDTDIYESVCMKCWFSAKNNVE